MIAFRQFPDYESASYVVSVLASQNRWKVNTYILTAKATGRSVIIDPAAGESELLDFLTSSDKSVDFVLLTHGHFDHLVSASAICKEYDVPCLVHRDDYRLVRQAPFYSVRFDGTKVTPPQSLLTFDSPDSPLAGESSEWNAIETIFSPGHTPGGCCFVVDNFVFTGDTIIREAVGRTDNPGADIDVLSHSIESLLGRSQDDGIIFPGHGRPWTIKEARAWWATQENVNLPKLDKFIQA